MTRHPPDPRAIIDELLGGMDSRSFAKLADAQRQLDAQVHAYNKSAHLIRIGSNHGSSQPQTPGNDRSR
jgi:hypothetical protein